MVWFLDANICLDLLDGKRPGSPRAVAWYMKEKEKRETRFLFFGDAITTLYYILAERRKLDKHLVANALATMMEEIEPVYLQAGEFLLAKEMLDEGKLNDLEDLMMLQAASRGGAEILVTRDKALLELGMFENIEILSIENVMKKKG